MNGFTTDARNCDAWAVFVNQLGKTTSPLKPVLKILVPAVGILRRIKNAVINIIAAIIF